MDERKQVIWNQDLTKELIRLYETYPCLYDTKHKLYSNKHARYEAYGNMCKSLQSFFTNMTVSVDDVKKKINNVRAQFNHQQSKMRDRVGKSGAGVDDDQFDPLPWWYNSLLFLVEHIKVRKGKSNLDDSFMNVQDSEMQDDVLSDINVFATCSSSSENSTKRQLNDSIVKENESKRRKLDEWHINDNIDSAVNTLTALQKTLDDKQNNDEFTQYGIFIANELRKFDDEEILDDTKLDINNIIHSAKKKIMARKRAGVIIDYEF